MFLATFIGNLGKDAEIVTGSNSRELTKLALGVDQGKNKGTVWVDVLMPHNPNLMPFLTKGTQLLVAGRCDVNVARGYLNVNCFADQTQLLGRRVSEVPAPNAVPPTQPVPPTYLPGDKVPGDAIPF